MVTNNIKQVHSVPVESLRPLVFSRFHVVLARQVGQPIHFAVATFFPSDECSRVINLNAFSFSYAQLV